MKKKVIVGKYYDPSMLDVGCGLQIAVFDINENDNFQSNNHLMSGLRSIFTTLSFHHWHRERSSSSTWKKKLITTTATATNANMIANECDAIAGSRRPLARKLLFHYRKSKFREFEERPNANSNFETECSEVCEKRCTRSLRTKNFFCVQRWKGVRHYSPFIILVLIVCFSPNAFCFPNRKRVEPEISRFETVADYKDSVSNATSHRYVFSESEPAENIKIIRSRRSEFGRDWTRHHHKINNTNSNSHNSNNNNNGNNIDELKLTNWIANNASLAEKEIRRQRKRHIGRKPKKKPIYFSDDVVGENKFY